jgi:predicted transcriptional regulator
MKIILEIEDTYLDEFLNLIQPLSYVNKEEGKDWWFELSDAQKKAIYQGVDDLDNGNVVADEDVHYGIRKRIEDAQKK